jgi:hypothetical protein
MSWSKIIAVAAVVVFGFGIATIDWAVAGEKQKIKSHGAQFTVKSHQIEVGGDEGHVMVIWENKTIYFNEITGESLMKSLERDQLKEAWVSLILTPKLERCLDTAME